MKRVTILTGKPTVASETLGDELIYKYHNATSRQASSIVCFPIKYKQEIKGICYLDNMVSNQSLSADYMEIMNALMTQAIISIENDRLSKKDPALHFNQTYFQEQCDKFNITKREQDVLKRMISSLTNKQIGKELSISVSTVKKHLYSIYRKTKAENREQLGKKFMVSI